jgi:hypothetical protein
VADSGGVGGGGAELPLPDESLAGATMFSMQIGQSRFVFSWRPFSCSDAKYTPPMRSRMGRPPPKGSTRIPGIRRCIAGSPAYR